MPFTDLYMKISFFCLRHSSSETHQHSHYRFSTEKDVVKPVTNWAASFCIFGVN